jgi:hypothetical protein
VTGRGKNHEKQEKQDLPSPLVLFTLRPLFDGRPFRRQAGTTRGSAATTTELIDLWQ